MVLWLVTRPYQGVIGASRLYAVQALNALMPGHFNDDLYLRYGSQDQFTIFTLIYRPALAFLGLAKGNMALLSVADALWLGGVISLGFSLFQRKRIATLAIVAVIVLPGGSYLKYGEQILTPRLFAEALTMLGLGAILRAQTWRAGLTTGLAMAFHPLMASPGLATLFLYKTRTHRGLLAGCSLMAGLLVISLALLGVQPFARLLVTFEPAWFAIVQTRNQQCFVSQWTFPDWLPVWHEALLALMIIFFTSGRRQQVMSLVFVVTLGGFVVSWIGGDLLHNVLILDAQLWRSAWLLGVVAHLLAVSLFLELPRHNASPTTYPHVLLGCSLGLLALTNVIPAMYLPALITQVGALLLATKPAQRRIKLTQAVGAACLGLAAGVALLAVFFYVTHITAQPSLLSHATRNAGLFVIALMMLITLLMAGQKIDTHALYAWIIPLISCALAITALCDWDQRSDWTRLIDDMTSPPPSLQAALPADERPLYWEGDAAEVPWFALKRQSYFSCVQGSGVLFSRGTALEYQRRFENFQALNTLDFTSYPFCPAAQGQAVNPLNRQALVKLCQQEPALGALVLLTEVAATPHHTWIAPVDFAPSPEDSNRMVADQKRAFFIYSCADLLETH